MRTEWTLCVAGAALLLAACDGGNGETYTPSIPKFSATRPIKGVVYDSFWRVASWNIHCGRGRCDMHLKGMQVRGLSGAEIPKPLQYGNPKRVENNITFRLRRDEVSVDMWFPVFSYQGRTWVQDPEQYDSLPETDVTIVLSVDGREMVRRTEKRRIVSRFDMDPVYAEEMAAPMALLERQIAAGGRTLEATLVIKGTPVMEMRFDLKGYAKAKAAMMTERAARADALNSKRAVLVKKPGSRF